MDYMYYMLKIKAIHPVLYEILLYKKFRNFIGYMGMPYHTHQKWYISLKKTLIFICMQKLNIKPHFIENVLHFKGTCNFIG